MPLLSYQGHLTRELCQQHPLAIFLFGDNRARHGFAGQAGIRNEPNTFGVPTKRIPANAPADFFDGDNAADQLAVVTSLLMVKAMARSMDVIVPVMDCGHTSLGTGLSQLPIKAPGLYNLINEQLKTEGKFNA